jgi:hypothetical protein
VEYQRAIQKLCATGNSARTKTVCGGYLVRHKSSVHASYWHDIEVMHSGYGERE